MMLPGEVEYTGLWPKIFKIPSKVEPFLFRNKDMFDVIRYLQTEGNVQIVQVFALPGVGKSSLIRNVTNYIAERGLYKDGILYLNMNKIEKVSDAIVYLCESLDPHKRYLDRERKGDSFDQLQNDLNFILNGYKSKLLIVLDNVECLLGNES